VRRTIATAALLLTACSAHSPGDSTTITVYAASSLSGAFTTIATGFRAEHPGTTITFQFGSSAELAAQLTAGAPADVFASAAPANMATVIAGGEASAASDFAANTAEIAVRPGNPKHISALADLAEPGLRVALCAPTAPCGALAAQILDNAGVHLTPTASEPDAKTTLAVLQAGEVDAAIVYLTDVRAAAENLTGVPIPAAENGVTTYPIATLTASKNPVLATEFVQYVRSSAGQQVLAAAGFTTP
jgi:molybdate transport system substrate-binding protein